MQIKINHQNKNYRAKSTHPHKALTSGVFRTIITCIFLLSLIGDPVHSKEPSIETWLSNATKELSKKQNESPARKLAKKVVEHYGGMKVIKKYHAMAVKEVGQLEQISSISGSSNKLSCELMTQGIKQHLKAKFMGQTVITCFNGKSCWTQQGDYAMQTDEITVKRIREDQEHGILLLESFLEPKRSLSLGKPKFINGKKCEALIVTANDGKPSIFYIDPSTYLIVRNEYIGTDSEQGIKCIKTYEYENYKDLEGFKTPLKTTEYSGSKKVSVYEVKTIEPDIKLSSKYFDLPEQKIPERLKAGPVKLPFRLVSNEILVEVKINGEKELVFLLDTGATQSILDTKAAKSLGMVNSGDFNITTGSGAIKMQFMNLDSMRLGELTINNIPVAVTSLKKFAKNLEIKPSGLLGANILKRFVITIDYPNEMIELRPAGTKLDASKGVIVSTKPSLGVSGLAVEGIIDNKQKLDLLLDSGAAFNHVSEGLIKDLITGTPVLPVGYVKGLDAKMVRTGAIKFNTIKLGDLVVKNPVFSIAPSTHKANPGLISGGNLAIIGNPLLSKFKITINYRDQKILFEKSNRQKVKEILLSELNEINRIYHNNEDASKAMIRLLNLKDKAVDQKQYALAGEVVADYTYYAAVHKKLKKEQIESNFTKAIRLAIVGKSKASQARVMARWAQYFLNVKPPQYVDYASSLVAKAIQTSPIESNPYAIAGIMMAGKEGKIITQSAAKSGTSSKKPPKAVLLLNQSLMLDPSNWEALWAKYDLANQNGKKKETETIARLLKRYYPQAKKVQTLD